MRRAATLAATFLFASAAAAEPTDAERARAETYPLVFLVEGDAVLASTPGAPDDPPPGAELRLRRVRAGDDVTLGRFRLRILLEGQSRNAGGAYFTPVEGGRIAGPMRVTDAYFSYRPHVAFHAEVGSMPVPFSLSRQVDASALRLPERAPIIDAVTPDFRVGAGIGGDLGELDYRAAVMAADPTLDGRLFSDGALVALRLAAEPIGPVGLTPWRRRATDPWDDWFRFSVGVSFLYGTVVEPRTIAGGADLQAQWRALVATGEYVYAQAPSGDEQGAVVEPGFSIWDRRLEVVARADWRRAGGLNQWGGGGALTLYARDPRLRLQAGFERRTAAGTGSDWAILRLTLAVD